MSLASLMTMTTADDQVFAFEHAMNHRTWFGAMAPLTRFSVLPYLLDPMQNTNIPAGQWNLNHQQAHNDALTTLPSYYNAATYGLPIGHILVDTDLQNQDQLKWWEFQNLVEHQVATATVLPQFAAQNTRWVYPFW